MTAKRPHALHHDLLRLRLCVPAACLAVVLLVPSRPGWVQAQTIRSDAWIANGTINAELLHGDTLYLGGSFSAVGPATGAGVPLSAATGLALPGFPAVDGQVLSALPDGSGGWFLGGAFTSVGGQPRANLAHVRADFSVDPWDPGANDAVRSLAKRGTVVYAGGSFTTIGGQPRNRVAALDSASGLATAWDPNASGQVNVVASMGSVVYVGGVFTTIGGQTRNRIAAIDSTTGAATAWDPNANSTVSTLVVDAARVYVGGSFTSVGGQARNRVAWLSPTTGAAGAWDPNANGSVFALAVDGGTVYLGGAFLTVGGQTRSRLAAVDAGTALILPWNPTASAQVLALAVSPSVVYAGGDFTSAGMELRSRIAAIDRGTGLATAWDPGAYGSVNTVALDDGVVFAGGTFNGMGGQRRGNLAAVDVHTGVATAWNPDANGAVQALAWANGRVIAGGAFTACGGQPRSNLAALDPISGAATAWNPAPDNLVSALAVAGSTVYAGGGFGNIGGQPRANIAALDDATGAATPWNPGANDLVFTLAADQGIVYVGGQFTTLGGTTRNRVGAVDMATGVATAWNPNVNGTVRAIAPNCGRVFIGGFFTFIGPVIRNYLGCTDATTGAATTWYPDPNGPVFTLLLKGPTLYAGGVLSLAGGQTRNRIVALSVGNATATSWNPNADGVVRTLAASDSFVYAGGSFAKMGGLGQTGFAMIDADFSLGCPAITLAPASAPDGRSGTPYNLAITASGGVPPYCWTLTGGTLPAGLTFDRATATLSGTPADTGAFAFSVQAIDANGCQATTTYAFQIRPPCVPITLVDPGPPDARVGVAYSHAFTATGGTPPFTWSLASGALPSGLALDDSTGVVSGTPATADTFLFTVRATDAILCEATRACTLLVRPPCQAIAIVSATLPDGVVGLAYAETLHATAGAPLLTWSVVSGSLPAGVTLGADGVLGGTPSAAATSTFTIAVTDSNLCSAERSYTVTMFAAPPVSFARANTLGLSIHAGAACVRVPVVLERGESAPARAISVTFAIDSTKLALCTPAPPESSIRAGSWLAGYDGFFQVTGNEDGTFTVDQSILGAPCGPTTGGELFTIDVTAADGDGTGAITVTAVHARDCDNVPVAVGPGPPGLLTICNAPLAFVPSALPNGVIGEAYAETLMALDGTAPYQWSVTSGSLPAGLSIDAGTAAITGTPTTTGTSTFTIGLADANGCGQSRSYTVNVFAIPPVSQVSVGAGGFCVSSAHPCRSVPVVLERGEATPALAVSVTIRIDVARLALCTPGSPVASVHQGGWLTGFGSTFFQVTDEGAGYYTIDQAILGGPCGPTTGDTLFSIDLGPVGPQGPAAIEVVAVHARACDNAPIPVACGAAYLTVDTLPPTPIADLAAAVLTSGNGADSTLGIQVTWSGATGPVKLYRAPFGAYPIYDRDAPGTAPDPAAVPGTPWQLVSVAATSGLVDRPERGFWYYVATVEDSCENLGISNRTGGALDYLLGDVADGMVAGHGDDQVRTEDVSLLGAHYGISGATIDTRGVAYLDVGPTVDAQPTSRPTPDHAIDIEDLSIFSINYGQTAMAPALASSAQASGDALPAGGSSGADPARVAGARRPVTHGAMQSVEAFSSEAPVAASAGDTVWAVIRMSGSGSIQAFSARLAWDAAKVEPIATISGQLIEALGGVLLVPRQGTVDGALLGVGPTGMAAAGEVARVAFHALGNGPCAIRLAQVIARDAANQPVTVTIDQQPVAVAETPVRTLLFAPVPNPARGNATLAFSLARAGRVELALYGPDGRRVRTLVSGSREAGVHRLTWDGRDDAGHPVASGVLFVRLAADGRTWTRTMVVAR